MKKHNFFSLIALYFLLSLAISCVGEKGDSKSVSSNSVVKEFGDTVDNAKCGQAKCIEGSQDLKLADLEST